MHTPHTYDIDKATFTAAHYFLEGRLKAEAIAEQLNLEFPGLRATREKVYTLVRQARKSGFLTLVPPPSEALALELQKRFVFEPHEISPVTVVYDPSGSDGEIVAEAAASIAIKLISQAKRTNTDTVGIGLGPGPSTASFSRALSRFLIDNSQVPKLDLVAIAAGAPSDRPYEAPLSFFNFFARGNTAAQHGLFAQPIVRAKDFHRIKQVTGFKETYAIRDNVSIVVSSMGDMTHPHSAYRNLMDECYPIRKKGPAWLKRVIGDVQYRPYTKDGPVVEEGNDLRPVTLFELSDLIAMVNAKKRFVLLIAKQCGLCANKSTMHTRAKALAPMLRWKPHLRPFTHLILDHHTAKELLAL